MPKFTLVCDHSCDLDTHVVSHQFNADTYWEVIEQFEMFLKGAGYVFDGQLDLVDPDPIVGCDVGGGDYGADTELSGAGNVHSHYYFDLGRNR